MSDATVKLMDITSDMSSALRAGAGDGQVMQRNGKRNGRMDDLIKREDAIGAFEEELNGVNIQEAIKVVDAYLRIRECDAVWDAIGAIRDCMECAKDAIAEFVPSADRPSKEGEWEIEEFTSIYGKGYRLTCSECGDVVTVTDEALPRECYCRYCGAKNTKRWKGADDE